MAEAQIKKMGDLGFMGMMAVNTMVVEWILSYAIAMEEISAIDASAAVIMSVNNSLVCYLIEHFGDDFQKKNTLLS